MLKGGSWVTRTLVEKSAQLSLVPTLVFLLDPPSNITNITFRNSRVGGGVKRIRG